MFIQFLCLIECRYFDDMNTTVSIKCLEDPNWINKLNCMIVPVRKQFELISSWISFLLFSNVFEENIFETHNVLDLIAKYVDVCLYVVLWISMKYQKLKKISLWRRKFQTAVENSKK